MYDSPPSLHGVIGHINREEGGGCKMGAVTFLRRKGFLGGPKMPTSLPVADKSIVGFFRCNP